MYSFPSFEPVHCSTFSSNYCILTCILVSQETGKVVVCCDPHSQRLSSSQWCRSRCFSGTPLLSPWCSRCWQFDSSAFSKLNLYIWNFLVHILLKPPLKDFEHSHTSMWNEHNCMVVWTFFGIALLWDWNDNWPFPVLWPLWSFLNLQTY